MPRATAQRVLVVDDDYSVVSLVEIALSRTLPNVEVIGCLDPLDALAQCATGRIRVFISDYQMPGFTGLELLEVLRQKHPEVRRLLLTAAPREPEVREAVQAGLVEWLIEKPWGRGELSSAVTAALSSSRP